ncbi:MAG: guanine permease [Bacillota bacterium]|nr:MAG: guanine permease [Bacillota bacterium]
MSVAIRRQGDPQPAAAARAGWLDRFFAIRASGSDVRTEVLAGVTTFVTMAYILFVNPQILSAAGLNPNAVLMATALSAGLATLLMGLFARLPFALAPGMGLNAYFAYSVVIGKGIPWQTVLGAVFLDGLFFLIISLLPIRERILRDIPLNLRLATSTAIGLFIAFIGLKSAGLIVANEATLVALGDVTSGPALLALLGLVVTALLMARRVHGAILWGVLFTTLAGTLFKAPDANGVMQPVTRLPESLSGIVQLPDFSVLGQVAGQLDVAGALGLGLITVVFTFTFVDMFDTAGTLVGLGTKMRVIDEKTGHFPGVGRALITDALSTMMGAVLGTSPVTTYVESAAGISQGGRTGLTAVVTGLLFLAAVFFWPLAGVIPAAATAPALIMVGLLMMEPIRRLNLDDITEALPAFLTVIGIPLTFSIATGLVLGIVSYVVLKLVTGRLREVSVTMWILAAIFIAYYAAQGGTV